MSVANIQLTFIKHYGSQCSAHFMNITDLHKHSIREDHDEIHSSLQGEKNVLLKLVNIRGCLGGSLPDCLSSSLPLFFPPPLLSFFSFHFLVKLFYIILKYILKEQKQTLPLVMLISVLSASQRDLIHSLSLSLSQNVLVNLQSQRSQI